MARAMTHDCFGNPTPGIPPSISDTHHDITRFRPVPFGRRLEYHYARINALVGRAPADRAWTLYYQMLEVIA
jgi:hypothetical protein